MKNYLKDIAGIAIIGIFIAVIKYILETKGGVAYE